MNKYLEKIASDRKEEGLGKRLAKGYGSLLAGSIASIPLMAGAAAAGKRLQSIVNSDDSVSDLGTIKKYMKDNKLHKTVSFNHRTPVLDKANLNRFQRAAADYSNLSRSPAYLHNSKGKSFVIGAKNVDFFGSKSQGFINKDVLMHELGHAKDFQRHAGIKQIGTYLGRGIPSQAIFGAATTGMLANDKTRDYAPAVAAIPGALTMREELAANYNAYKGIKAHKGAVGANKFLKNVAKHNTINYGLAAAAPVAAAYVGKKIMDKWSPRKTDAQK